MENIKQLQGLKQLTEAVYESERATFSKLVSRENEIRGQIDDLMNMRPDVGNVGKEYTPAGRVGADMNWQQWIEQRKEVLNHELVQVLALKYAQKDVYGRAFGRHQVVSHLNIQRLKLSQKEQF